MRLLIVLPFLSIALCQPDLPINRYLVDTRDQMMKHRILGFVPPLFFVSSVSVSISHYLVDKMKQ